MRWVIVFSMNEWVQWIYQMSQISWYNLHEWVLSLWSCDYNYHCIICHYSLIRITYHKKSLRIVWKSNVRLDNVMVSLGGGGGVSGHNLGFFHPHPLHPSLLRKKIISAQTITLTKFDFMTIPQRIFMFLSYAKVSQISWCGCSEWVMPLWRSDYPFKSFMQKSMTQLIATRGGYFSGGGREILEETQYPIRLEQAQQKQKQKAYLLE